VERDVSPLLVELGFFCVQRGMAAEAQSLLKGAQVLRPQDPAPGMFLGMSHFASGGYAEAERTYRGVLEKHDDDLTRAFLAESLIAQRRWAEAKALLQEVVAHNRHAPAVNFAKELLGALERGIFERAGS
jgi:Flp pilus assembly protein TadD